MHQKIFPYILRCAMSIYFIFQLLSLSCSAAEVFGDALDNPACTGFSTNRTTAKTYNGKLYDFSQSDMPSMLYLSDNTTWYKESIQQMKVYSNADGDHIYAEPGRIYYIRENVSRTIDRLFSQLLSDIYCTNNNDIYNESVYNLSVDRENGIQPDDLQNAYLQHCYENASLVLNNLIPNQDPLLLNIFIRSTDNTEYTCLVYGFKIDGLPIYGYNEACINIINPDETETAVRELAVFIYDQSGIACIDINQIMNLEYNSTEDIIPADVAANKLKEWISLVQNDSYVIHQYWLSEVPLGDFSHEPIKITPCWSFFLTWEEKDHTWCATPRINTLTGDLLWW